MNWREQLRVASDTFIQNTPDTAFSEISRESLADGNVGLNTVPETIQLSEDNIATGEKGSFLTLQGSYSNVTAATQPYLPMTISTVDTARKRVSFTLLINPETLNHSKTSALYPTYTREGYVIQAWGPNQDLLSSTGKTAGFMVDGDGLTSLGGKRSIAYSNFLALFKAYRNNGYTLYDITKNQDRLHRVINYVHGVEIAYDNQTYLGHFTTFTMDEDSERPFLLNYNFEFFISDLGSDNNEIRGHYDPIPATLNTNAQVSRPLLTGEVNSFVKGYMDLMNPDGI